MTKKLDSLREKEAALLARLHQVQSQRKEISRKEDTRRKVLIGAVVLNRIEQGLFDETTLQAWLREGLTRNIDRAVFGLPELAETQVETTAAKAEKSKKKAVVSADQVVVGTVEKKDATTVQKSSSKQARNNAERQEPIAKKLPVTRTQDELQKEFLLQ